MPRVLLACVRAREHSHTVASVNRGNNQFTESLPAKTRLYQRYPQVNTLTNHS